MHIGLLYLYYLTLKGIQNILGTFKASFHMCFVLTVDQVLYVRHQHGNFLEVKHVHSFVPCKCGVQNIHAHCWVLYHAQCVKSMSNIILFQNIIHNNFNICTPSLHYTIESGVTFHTLINNFNIFF